ncbi:MAG: helix-turn-helix domain-containing protein [Nitrososphaeria archaeon]|jgi:predicted DNA binding protein
MRRIVLEWSIKDLENLKGVDKSGVEFSNQEIKSLGIQRGLKMLEMLQKTKSFEVLHILRTDQDEFAYIFKVETKDPSFNIKDLLLELVHGTEVKLQLLQQEKEGTRTYFIKGKLPHPSPETNSKRINMYPLLPFSFRDGKVRVALLGDNNQVEEFLEFVEKAGTFRVVSLMDAKFLPSSPVNRLTGKQRDAIILAFKLGYFDTPRKISSEQLATKLGLASSTLAIHLRRAERRLLAEMLNE